MHPLHLQVISISILLSLYMWIEAVMNILSRTCICGNAILEWFVRLVRSRFSYPIMVGHGFVVWEVLCFQLAILFCRFHWMSFLFMHVKFFFQCQIVFNNKFYLWYSMPSHAMPCHFENDNDAHLMAQSHHDIKDLEAYIWSWFSCLVI